jgi:transcriptional regulator GlxA family with amidase domain
MQIALALYPNFTMLDIIGPFQVLVDVPGHEVVFVAAEAGPVVDHTGRATLIATQSFAEVPTLTSSSCPAVSMTPNSNRADRVASVRCTRRRHGRLERVCTGAIYLAAAGILDGLDATTHWVRKPALEQLGALHRRPRGRRQARSSAAAGVSSGIDMALCCSTACTTGDGADGQLAIGVRPAQPPFDTGSPAKAPADLVDLGSTDHRKARAGDRQSRVLR